eukprot:sb/3476342/
MRRSEYNATRMQDVPEDSREGQIRTIVHLICFKTEQYYGHDQDVKGWARARWENEQLKVGNHPSGRRMIYLQRCQSDDDCKTVTTDCEADNCGGHIFGWIYHINGYLMKSIPFNGPKT